MNFTIIKIGANNFSHFDGFKEMNFSNWEIVFNYTDNTLILQMLNGAPFPKKEVLASDVIIKNGVDGTPEVFGTIAEIRARLVELNYNPLQSSGGGSSAEWGAITGDIEEQEDLTDYVIPRGGTIAGKPIIGDLIFDNANGVVSLKGNNSDNQKIEFRDDSILNISSDADINITANNITIDASEDSSGMTGTNDFTPNLTDLSYPQKIYTDTKLAKDNGTTYDTNFIKTVTQAEYDAIGTPDATTLYFIV